MRLLQSGLTRSQLRKATKQNPNGVIRLGLYLRLDIQNMSASQVAGLIRWRVKR